jgi:hypothetical protein
MANTRSIEKQEIAPNTIHCRLEIYAVDEIFSLYVAPGRDFWQLQEFVSDMS